MSDMPPSSEPSLLLRAAWQLHDIHERSRPEVSLPILLLAAAKTNPAVLHLLRNHGLDLVRFEEGLPRRKPSAEPAPAPLDQRFSRWYHGAPEQIEAPDAAATVLENVDGADLSRLTDAGLDVEKAAPVMTAFAAGNEPWDPITMQTLRTLRMSVTTERVLNAAIQRGASFGAVSTSMLVVAMLEDEQPHPGSGPEMLQQLVRGSAGQERVRADIATWMRFYETTSPREDLPLTFYELFRYAREIAIRVSGEPEIKGRHLVGAILASRDLSLGANGLLARFIDPSEMAQRFANYLEQVGVRERDPDDMTAWRRLLGVADRSAVPRYDSEGYTRRDDLGISTDVDAFAALIASKALQPPMSIGLFGDWGSGKSFFMSHLRDAVADLAGTSDSFHERIVQIDFNAWHYVEANLWASLVENIFRNLKPSHDPLEDASDRTKAVLQRIDQTLVDRTAAEKKVEEAQLSRNVAAESFERRKAEVEKSATKLSLALAKDVWEGVTVDAKTREEFSGALKELGIDRAVQSSEDVRATVDEIRQLGGRTRLLWVWMTHKPLTWALLCVLIALAPLGFAAVTSWLKTLGGFRELSTTIAQLTGIVATIVGWLSVQLKRGGTAIGMVEKAKEQIDKLVEKAESEKKKAIQDEQAALNTADEELKTAQQALQTQNEELEKAQKELLELRAGRQLARFIDDRAASDDYRKLLGVLAKARNDFETLSALMRRQDDEQPLPAHLADILPIEEKFRIDRIVLYIDDLDRCPPHRVVEVLQAVHLLLAFKLFVVVVGVDARWVSESLEYRFRHVWKTANGKVPGYSVGPRDYLEKIFQIPFWLNALGIGATRRFVTRLVDADLRIGSGGRAEQPRNGEDRVAPAGGNTPAGTQASGEEPSERRERLASAAPLQLTAEEGQWMKELADLIGRSPRTVKRYINTYRIIRATIPPRRLDSFLVNDSRAILLLLAIMVGVPDQAFAVFKQMESSGMPSAERLAAEVANESVRSALKAFGNEPLDTLRRHIETVSRYSFDRREK